MMIYKVILILFVFLIGSTYCFHVKSGSYLWSSKIYAISPSKPGIKRKPIVLPDLSQKSFPTLPEEDSDHCNYDLVVLGSGPAGEAAAVHASKLGARVAVIEKKKTFGGPTGLTSKAIREAAKRLCNAIDQIGGDRRKQIKNLWKRSFPVLKSEAEVYQAKETRDRLMGNKVDLFIGEAVFVSNENDSNNSNNSRNINNFFNFNFNKPQMPRSNHPKLRVCRPAECVEMTAKNVIIATGSRPNRPTITKSGLKIPFLKNKVVDATEIGGLLEIPNAAAVMGGGVIAVEYATVLAQLGVGVSLICKQEEFLPFLDRELRHQLRKRMRQDHVLLVTNTVKEITIDDHITVSEISSEAAVDPITWTQSILSNSSAIVRVYLNNDEQPQYGMNITSQRLNRVLKVDLLLYSGGRDANSENLDLHAVNVTVGRYGRIEVDSTYKTTSSLSIYAVGDVNGIAGLASSAQYQARYVTDLLFRDMKSKSMVNEKKSNKSLKTEDESGYDMDLDVAVDDFFVTTRDTDVVNETLDEDDTEKGEDAKISKNLSKLQKESTLFGNNVPLTLWTVPEISSVGLTIDQAEKLYGHIPDYYVIQGYGYFKDMARGRLSGDIQGFLKVITLTTKNKSTPRTQETRTNNGNHKILGVQIIGEGANELIQFGSMLVNSGTTIEEVSRTPFAAVTLCGLFQLACDDSIQKIKDLYNKK